MTVEKYELSESLTIARAISGLWQIADMTRNGRPLDIAATAEFMIPYVDAGLTTFDMADHYGSAELISGHFHRHLANGRPHQLLTKWVPKPGPVDRAMVRGAVEERCERLQVDKVDLLQFHAWRFADPAWLDALSYLQELKDEGLIGNLGVTNFDTAHLRIALHSGINVVSNQVSYSLLDQRASKSMTELCLEHGVGILAYGTVAGGLFSERWVGQPDPGIDDLPTWSLMKYRRFVEVIGGWDRFQELLHEMRDVSAEAGVSIPQVASRFILQQPAVAAVIVGARLGQSAHTDETAGLFSFQLTDDQVARLRAVAQSLQPIQGDCGDEYRQPPYLTASGDLSHHLEDFPAPFTVEVAEDGVRRVTTGTSWERDAGYCRAVQYGDRISISGTTATHRGQVVGGNDAEAQAHFIIDIIDGALASLGATMKDVVRTRIFVANMGDWEGAARAHGVRFRTNRPANTLVEAGLVGDQYRVEIEAEAWLR